jgi:predicted acyl esterase
MTDVLIEKNVGATMRDGTVMRADVYRPAETTAAAGCRPDRG